MNESSPAPDGNPYEPPRSDTSITSTKPERRALRWYHWLAFFSPAMVSVSFAAMGGGSIAGLERAGVPGLILGALLCLVNGVWLSRVSSTQQSGLNGCLWMFCGLIVNAALAFGGCALVLR